ncbi:DNA alkylation repair protein [Sulfidibacter corallicola]|uniref:DNA alkylation repair protein n=1 Tax=Sulfidibacter corallicola TaxID=2818388 RepID=A0A8A4TPX8_SULCO|nr:DNA alkylation repair protein [Sulfidibacter corallicola]QTD51487.1 DNA alkylation repair protein [Sulfidibacter corallicola]
MSDRDLHPHTLFLFEGLRQHADPVQAVPMQAYMKTDQPFYGVRAPVRKQLCRDARAKYPLKLRDEYERVVRELWAGPHREDQHAALDVAENHRKHRIPASMPLYVDLANAAPHWDTLDTIAGGLISRLVQSHREFESILRDWITSPNMWLRRASLLGHLKHKHDTNRAFLSETILALCHEKEFFIRKAIGWVLRDYSYANPEWVIAFVQQHDAVLAPLSKREALKAIERKKRK